MTRTERFLPLWFFLLAIVWLALAYPVASQGQCLFHRHATASQGSTGGTYVAQREVTRTYSYGSAGGVPTQVLAAPRTAVLPRLRSILRRPVLTVTPEAPAEPAKPVVGAKCDCGCDCPNCTCNKQEPLTAKKE